MAAIEEKKCAIEEKIKDYPELAVNEKTRAIQLGQGYRWYDQVNDRFHSFEEVMYTLEEKERKRLKSFGFIQLSPRTIEFLRELFIIDLNGKITSGDYNVYLTTEVQSAWSTSNRQTDLLQYPPSPHLANAKHVVKNTACNHSHPSFPKMRIITPKYFDFQWSEKFVDIIRSYEWMNPLEWIRVDERYGTLCTGIFKRLAQASRIYDHGHKASDNHFLCVMDNFLSPGECKILAKSSVPSEIIKKIIAPFMTTVDVVAEIADDADAKNEDENKEKEEKGEKKKEKSEKKRRIKNKPKPTTHLAIFLDDQEHKEKLVFDSFGATIESSCGRAVWWRLDEHKSPSVITSNISIWHTEVK